MQRIASLALTSLAALALAAAGCDAPAATAQIANPDPTRCIVSGEKLPQKPTIVEVGGKKYGICCEDCEPALRKDLDRYLKNPGSGSMHGK